MESEIAKAFMDETNQKSKVVNFFEGLPAFEEVKEFVILSNEEEAPFLWLQSVKNPNLAFITIDPFLIMPEYRPDIADEDVEALQIESEEDVLMLSIVTISNDPDEGVTANLVGPVVINWKKRLGKQAVIKNHQDYTVKFRIDNLDE
jgi:flagellar assembly factor FliW